MNYCITSNVSGFNMVLGGLPWRGRGRTMLRAVEGVPILREDSRMRTWPPWVDADRPRMVGSVAATEALKEDGADDHAVFHKVWDLCGPAVGDVTPPTAQQSSLGPLVLCDQTKRLLSPWPSTLLPTPCGRRRRRPRSPLSPLAICCCRQTERSGSTSTTCTHLRGLTPKLDRQLTRYIYVCVW